MLVTSAEFQVVPHVTDALQEWIVNVSKKPVDQSDEQVGGEDEDDADDDDARCRLSWKEFWDLKLAMDITTAGTYAAVKSQCLGLMHSSERSHP